MADHNQNNHNEKQPGQPRFYNDEVDDALPHQVTHHYNNYEHHVQQHQQYCNHDEPQHHCQIMQTIYGQQYYYNGQNHNPLLGQQQQYYLHGQQQQHYLHGQQQHVQQIQHDHGQQQHMQLYYNDHNQNHNVEEIQTNHGQQCYYNNGPDHQDGQNHNHIFPGRQQQKQQQQQQQQRQGGERELTDEEFDAYFPKGMRFYPTDEELLKYYLHRKANNVQLPRNRIREVMLYQHHPKTLTDMHKMHTENVWYFFTSRTRKYPNGSRPDRKVGDHGYWKATGDEKPVGHPIVYGYKMALDFYEGKLPKDKTDWKMIEFTVEKTSKLPTLPKSKSSSPHQMKLNGWALCKVYINSRAKKKDEAVPIANGCDGQGSSHTPTDPFTSGSAHYNHNSYSSSSMGQTLDSNHRRTSPVGPPQQSQPSPMNTGPGFEYPISSSRVGSDLNYEQGLPTPNDETSNAYYTNDTNLEFKYSGEP